MGCVLVDAISNILIRILISSLVGLGIMLQPGCSPNSSSEVGADEVARASYLIDKKQYSESIYILEAHLRKQPIDNRARVVLASAYAARAGILLSSYTHFVAELEKWNKIDELLSSDSDTSPLQLMAKATFRIQIVLRAFDALPVAQGATSLADLNSALSTLDQAGKLNGGPAIYRALLRIAAFKHNVRLAMKPLVNLTGCRIEVIELLNWLKRVGFEIERVVGDVVEGVANSATKKSTLEFSSHLSNSLSELNKISPTLIGSVEIPVFVRKVTGACE